MGKFDLLHMDKVINNMNKEIRKIEGRTTQGLVEAGEFIHNRMEPKVPKDTGNLRESWFIITAKGAETSSPSFIDREDRKDASRMVSDHARSLQEFHQEAKQQRYPFMVMGFSAYYAKAVHEMIDATFKTPGTQARFMYSTIQQNSDRALRIIAENARIR